MTKKKNKRSSQEIKALISQEDDFLRPLMKLALEEVLGAAKSERSAQRQGYRSGYYQRKLITRVGTLELRVPQDRQGRFSTEVFERYQRSEKALVAALVEMYEVSSVLRSGAFRNRKETTLCNPTVPSSRVGMTASLNNRRS